VLSKQEPLFANALFSEPQWVRGRLNLRGGCSGPSVLRRPAHQSLKHHQSRGQHRAGLSVLRRAAPQCVSASKSSAVCAVTVNSSARRATLMLRPGPASTQRLRCFVLALRPASAVRPMPAAVWVAFVALQRPQALRSRNQRAVCEQNTVTANPSIERTNNGWRACAASAAVCGPLFAAHVER
jgi:hypothetical protein